MSIWTPKTILAAARRFEKTEDWRLSSHGSFSAAKRMGLYDKACAHMKTNKRLTKEFVVSDAARFDSKSEWKKASASAYKKARQAGWLEEACAHMDTLWEKKWDKESLSAEAQKYKTRNEWLQESPNSYQAAHKMGVADEISIHMEWLSHRNKWTEEAIKLEAKKYGSRSEWAKNSPGSYEAAMKIDKRDVAASHMDKLWQKRWDKESILESSSKHASPTSWIREFSGAYKAAKSKDFVAEACAHMIRESGKSSQEIDLFNTIKNKFPKAHSTIFSNKDTQYVAKKFELDVYIPELRKGIEFDGTYWHSPKGLKRGRPNWSDEQIENYHSLKDSFFKSKGIDILHIKEADWLDNKLECLKKVEEFLGVQNER